MDNFYKSLKSIITQILVIVFFTSLSSCNGNNKIARDKIKEMEIEASIQIAEANKANYAKMPYFPAETSFGDDFFSVQITAISGMYFLELFDQHQLYGNGYCWAGIVEQLVDKENAKLLEKITIDAEADVCFISCPDKQSMTELAQIIHDFCSTKDKMIKVLKNINKSKMDC